MAKHRDSGSEDRPEHHRSEDAEGGRSAERGRRGGYGRSDAEEDYYRQSPGERGRQRGARSGRRHDPGGPRHFERGGYEPGRRAGQDRFAGGAYDTEGYGQGTYERGGYGLGESRQGGYSEEGHGASGFDQGRSEQERRRDRDYSLRGERGYGDFSRGYPPHTENPRRDAYEFGRFQGGFQGAYEERPQQMGYGDEAEDDENTYYEGSDEDTAYYGHGPQYEGLESQTDYRLDAGFTTGGSRGSLQRGEFYGRGPRGYTRSDDRIREDVCDRLSEHGGIDAADVEVKVDEGEVTLEGTVRSRRMKHDIENVASTVLGVKDVSNKLRIGRPEGQQAED
jgi:hypothetical protein